MPHKGKVRIFGTILQFTADNLGLNQVFGLVQSFHCDYCCALCYATREEMQLYFEEKYFELRTPEKYEQDLRSLELSESENILGVVRRCVLNELIFFKIMSNWINDCMHTLFEGIIPYVMACVLHTLIFQEKIFTLEKLNDCIQTFFLKLKVNKKHKPSIIKNISGPPKMTLIPSLKAAESWCLFIYLPLILSKLVYKRNKHWQLLLMLQEITDIVMAPKITDAMLTQFDLLYFKFLNLFQFLYPNQSIRPKMHFLVHFSTIVRKNGPMRNYWAMNYERLNGAIKKPAHTMNNFKDPIKTLAFKRQSAMLHAQLSKKTLRDAVEIGAISKIPLKNFPQAELLKFFRPSEETIQVSTKITINGVLYSAGMFMAMEKISENNLLAFAKIDRIICEDCNNPLFALSAYSTIEFDQHCFSYIVEKKSPSTCLIKTLQSFVDYHPLDCVHIDGKYFIRRKYFIW